MKIRKSIENALAKAKEKSGVPCVATVRQDTVRKAIERGEFEKIKCAYDLTDDYAWDAANEFGWKKSVTKETMAREYSILTPSCWVSPKTFEVNGKECYEISISFHSNLAYDMYVPVLGEEKKSLPNTEPEKNNDEVASEIEVMENVEKNGLEIKFDCKPSEGVRSFLKENKFRWHKAKQIWYAKRNENTVEAVETLKSMYA